MMSDNNNGLYDNCIIKENMTLNYRFIYNQINNNKKLEVCIYYPYISPFITFRYTSNVIVTLNVCNDTIIKSLCPQVQMKSYFIGARKYAEYK
jgi:hypothetical protein